MAEVDFKQWLSELKSRCDIVSTFNKYCHVVQKGRSYWTCCPFHIEKTPSLCIYELEQTYHCYGCKEHGDIIKFVMKMESCDFLQAIEILAKSVGMEVPDFAPGSDKEGIQQRKKEKDMVLKCLAEANKHYQENLYKDIAKPAQEYIKKRRLTKTELDNFGLGYSINYYELINHLKSKGYSEDIMQKSGLGDKGDRGFYDNFGGRLMFPLYNIYNECIGFSGRILTSDPNKAKYKNSPNTIVFDKSNTVFGLNIVRKNKQSQAIDKIIIVEGQMDVIAMHRAGFTNAVASLGTAFTEKHGKQLKLIANNVLVCLDGDKAGQNATNKVVDILAGLGFNVRVIKLPGGMDPDEYIKEYGKEEMQKRIDDAIDYIDFQIDFLSEGVDFSKSDEKANFVKKSLELLKKLSTTSERQIYLKHIKDLSGVPINVLQQDVYLTENVNSTEKKLNEVQNIEDGSNRAIKFILASMLYKKDYAKFHKIDEYLHNDTYVKLLNLMREKMEKGEEFKVSSLYDEFDMENEPNLIDIINYNFEQNGNNQKYYEECLWSLYEKRLKDRQRDLNEKFSVCKDVEERKQILLEITNITKKLKNKEMED